MRSFLVALLATAASASSVWAGEVSKPGPEPERQRAEDRAATLGTWSITHLSAGNRQVAVVAELAERATYRICRNRWETMGTGSSELYVYVDDLPLRSTGTVPTGPGNPLNNFSLDHGSCVIAAGRKFALVYSGMGAPTLASSLNGLYARLRPDLTAVDFQLVMPWAMNWVAGETQRHDTVLVDQVPGQYRVCVTAGEVLPPTAGQVALALEVDGKIIRFNNAEWGSRSGCIDVNGSRLVMRQLTWPPSITAYRVSGTLSLLPPP